MLGFSLSRRHGYAFAAAAALATSVTGGTAQACSADSPYIGSICTIVTNYCPEGYLPADGRILTINNYQALYSLIGTLFGGSAQQGTFALPDLRGRSVVGQGQGPGLPAVARGQSFGTPTTQLSLANMPAHNHNAAFTPVVGQQQVTLPAVTGSLTVDSTLPVGTATTTVAPAVTAGQATFLTNASTSNPGTQMRGLYTQTEPTSTGSIAVTSIPSGNPSIPQQTVTINTVIGGSVTVGNSGGSTPFTNEPPRIGLMQCIATLGIYPTNPN
ncbi:phage tail protein [Oceanibaculum pacificum]|uniref:Phage tail collar domain-containing protein n=1 Tax=Oceanibaculum pacificum TaxID=580166 RepID=A0A154VNW1_9PROT|nr:tail fiber protein [Oceanibaculum pacificum]KZD03047.1 hypothetical protein AUP43_03220 [Oceanibaculum pacificum]